jgi:hypothetical protein
MIYAIILLQEIYSRTCLPWLLANYACLRNFDRIQPYLRQRGNFGFFNVSINAPLY